MSKVRVSIIGTSNGINSRGYATALSRHPGAEIVCNASRGSSHSSLIGAQMPLIAQSGADVCVLDLCVNEHRASGARQYDFAESWRALDFFAERCTTLGMLPVVLLLPQAHPQKGFQTATVDLWRKECAARGLPTLDVERVARTVNPDAPLSLWPDPSHPDANLSARVADLIVQARDRIAAAPRRIETRAVHPYQNVENLSSSPVERKNSRFTGMFWQIPFAEHSKIDLGHEATIVGIGLNAARTNATLRIEGDSVLEKHLDNILCDFDRPMWHVVWNILSPVTSTTGRFRLQSVVIPAEKATERTDHYSAARCGSVAAGAGPSVELASLIARLPAQMAPVAAFACSDLSDMA